MFDRFAHNVRTYVFVYVTGLQIGIGIGIDTLI